MWLSLNHGLTAAITDPGQNRTWLFSKIMTKMGVKFVSGVAQIPECSKVMLEPGHSL